MEMRMKDKRDRGRHSRRGQEDRFDRVMDRRNKRWVEEIKEEVEREVGGEEAR